MSVTAEALEVLHSIEANVKIVSVSDFEFLALSECRQLGSGYLVEHAFALELCLTLKFEL